MYQPLICRVRRRKRLGHHACGFAAALDAKLFQRSANALVDRMRADAELVGDFLAAVVPVDEQQAVDLALAEAGHGGCRIYLACRLIGLAGRHGRLIPSEHGSIRNLILNLH
jgi:hypothetical protein